MKVHCSIICLFASIFISISTNSSFKNSKIIENDQNYVSEVFVNDDMVNSLNFPYQTLEEAIYGYQNVFSSYLKVLSINVDDKTSINLSNYDSSYIVPSYQDIMFNRQINFESSLNSEDLTNYELLKENNEDFDKYVAMNYNKYTDLDPKTTYSHNDISPSSSVLSTGIGAILLKAGLGRTVITAFNASITTLKTALASLTVPFYGQVIASGIAIGALIAITSIIVLNWEQITTVFEEIKEYFKEEFNRLKTLIERFFSDCENKIRDSLKTSTELIGGTLFTFLTIKSTDVESHKRIMDETDEDDILLMKSVNRESFEISFEKTNFAFCVSNKTHKDGYSSYTKKESKAKSLIIEAGTGYTSDEPEIDKSTHDGKLMVLFMYHYHNYEMINEKIDRSENETYKKTHSFFGNLYHRINKGEDPTLYV